MDIKRTAELAGIKPLNESDESDESDELYADNIDTLIKRLEELKKKHGKLLVGHHERGNDKVITGVDAKIEQVNGYGGVINYLVFNAQ